MLIGLVLICIICNLHKSFLLYQILQLSFSWNLHFFYLKMWIRQIVIYILRTQNNTLPWLVIMIPGRPIKTKLRNLNFCQNLAAGRFLTVYVMWPFSASWEIMTLVVRKFQSGWCDLVNLLNHINYRTIAIHSRPRDIVYLET